MNLELEVLRRHLVAMSLRERIARSIDGYDIGDEVGSGGMAVVFDGMDPDGRRVAVKVLRPELASLVGWERFVREIELTRQLEHPAIIPLWGSGVVDGLPYYVMPYVVGPTLTERLIEGPLPLEEAVNVMLTLLDALAYAHANGVVHRDIKPDNIILGEDGWVVADFGLARALDSAGGDKLTATGRIVGTPSYMSPEQATGSRAVDERSDIYSAGCVLYEMLSGARAFEASTPDEVIARRFADEPPQLPLRGAPRKLRKLYKKMLAVRPEDRWDSARDLAESLEALDLGEKPANRLVAGVLILLLLLMLAFLVRVTVN